jgi:hypothetical protein
VHRPRVTDTHAETDLFAALHRSNDNDLSVKRYDRGAGETEAAMSFFAPPDSGLYFLHLSPLDERRADGRIAHGHHLHVIAGEVLRSHPRHILG